MDCEDWQGNCETGVVEIGGHAAQFEGRLPVVLEYVRFYEVDGSVDAGGLGLVGIEEVAS
jgi:hypothetical protein